MKKRLPLLLIIIAICLMSCGQNKIETNKQHQNIFAIDTSVIAILPFDATSYHVFKDSKPTNLTNNDVIKIDKILNEYIKEYNPDQEKEFNKIKDKYPQYKLKKEYFIIDLTRYKRQYEAVINSKGEKEVWVNCFCKTDNSNWKNERLVVKDGGNCYFNLKINLATGQYYDLMVNGNG